MQLLSLEDIAALRSRLEAGDMNLDRATLERLLAQASYAVEATALLRELEHFQAEPYSEAAEMVSMATNSMNELWNKYRYLDAIK